VRVHFHTNAGRVRRDELEEIRIATWFADFPNPDLAFEEESSSCNDSKCNLLNDNHHWYSLHQMVAAGLGLGVLPGEWYGPTTACHVLRELNELHCSHLQKRHKVNKDQIQKMFRIHVATEGCIYLDTISNLMTNAREQSAEVLLADDPLRIPPSTSSTTQEWETSLLLLLPLRLGIQSIPTESYGASLSKLLALSQSVGMLGGTPRHALWFYGAEDIDWTSTKVGGWYGLDPHITQPAPRGELEEISNNNTSNNNTNYRWKVHLDEEYLRSLHIGTTSHSNHERSIPLSKLDPTLALGFYITNYNDFASFRQSVHSLNAECKKFKLPCIVSILDRSPNYEVDVGEVMKNMALNKREEEMDGFSMESEDDGELEEDDDDDEYVLV
jgi:cysteine protease ATG4